MAGPTRAGVFSYPRPWLPSSRGGVGGSMFTFMYVFLSIHHGASAFTKDRAPGAQLRVTLHASPLPGDPHGKQLSRWISGHPCYTARPGAGCGTLTAEQWPLPTETGQSVAAAASESLRTAHLMGQPWNSRDSRFLTLPSCPRVDCPDPGPG